MAYKQNSSSVLHAYIFHFSQTFFLKLCVAYRQYLINDQNIRFKMGCYCKCQTHIHTAAVSFYRCIDIPFHSRKINYLIKLTLNLAPHHTEYGSIEKNIVPARELRVKSRSHFQQRSNTSFYFYLSRSWRSYF